MQRKLIIMRHGEAEEPSLAFSDHSRSLTRGGAREAEAVGRTLCRDGHWPQLVLVSDAQRTQQTLVALERGAGHTAPQRLVPLFYRANVDDVLAEVAGTVVGEGSLLVLGHNPTWSALVEELSQQACRLHPADCWVLTKTAASWHEAMYDQHPWRLLTRYVAAELPLPAPTLRL